MARKASMLSLAALIVFGGFAGAAFAERQDGRLAQMQPITGGDERLIDREQLVSELTPVTGETARVDLYIEFELASAALTADARAQLRELAAALHADELRAATFRVNGHTDASGADAFNMRLSEARAQSVATFLTDVEGVDPERLTVRGYGETRLKNPLSPRASENRRVEIIARLPDRKPSRGALVPITE